jgi:hypothetical protein
MRAFVGSSFSTRMYSTCDHHVVRLGLVLRHVHNNSVSFSKKKEASNVISVRVVNPAALRDPGAGSKRAI